MCFRNSMNKKARELAKRYGRKTDIIEIYKEVYGKKLDEKYHYSAFPVKGNYTEYPVITDKPEIQVYEWGLIPFWKQPKKEKDTEADKLKTVEEAYQLRRGTFNARSETLYEKSSFRNAIASNRCIIPSTGYFEYHQNEDRTKTPYFIYLNDREIFSMGGIYDHWRNPMTGQTITTFSLITTESNDLTGWIHNGEKNPHRMPLILSPEEENRWLDPELKKDEIINMMHTYPSENMAAYPIDRNFIKYNPADPSIIREVHDNEWDEYLKKSEH